MKKLSIAFIFCALMLSSVTHAQKRHLSESEIPSQITSYIEKYFPEATIKKAKEEKEPLKTEYEVKLTPKAELEFDGDYNITEIEVKTGVPMEALPQKVQSYLTQNYPDAKVKEWKLKTGGQKVKLVNGGKLYFDTEGNFAGVK